MIGYDKKGGEGHEGGRMKGFWEGRGKGVGVGLECAKCPFSLSMMMDKAGSTDTHKQHTNTIRVASLHERRQLKEEKQ